MLVDHLPQDALGTNKVECQLDIIGKGYVVHPWSVCEAPVVRTWTTGVGSGGRHRSEPGSVDSRSNSNRGVLLVET